VLQDLPTAPSSRLLSWQTRQWSQMRLRCAFAVALLPVTDDNAFYGLPRLSVTYRTREPLFVANSVGRSPSLSGLKQIRKVSPSSW
jgi:hypothetical protein